MEGSLVAYKVFTNGSVLNASEINDNLMNQAVMVFSNSATRAAALTAPVEGMLTWLEDSNKYQYRNGSGAWVDLGSSGILQVVSTTKTDVFSASVGAGGNTAITGLTATITPSSTSSHVLVMATVSHANLSVDTSSVILTRGGSALTGATGNVAGSRTRATASSVFANTAPILFRDSPNTVSATTYGVNILSHSGATTTVVANRWSSWPDNALTPTLISTITVMEVAG